MMLSKKERLTRTLFNRSFSVGKRTHTPHVQLIVSKTEAFHGSVVVSKKVYKKAVDRNKLRRQLYAQLYQFNKAYPTTNTYILITKPSITNVPLKEVFQELNSALLAIR